MYNYSALNRTDVNENKRFFTFQREHTKFSTILLCLIPFANFFTAFSFFNIGLFNVTIPFIISVLFITVRFGELIFLRDVKFEHLLFFLSFVFVLLLAFAVNRDSSVTSFFLYLYFSIFYFVLFTKRRQSLSPKYLFIFVLVGTIINTLGIIQFVSQFTSIGYLSFSFGSHSSVGYNTNAVIYTSFGVFYRAHSIYLEPSILSQQCALVIITSLYLVFKKKINWMVFIVTALLNSVAILTSISGTGVLHLLVAFILMCFLHLKRNRLLFVFSILLFFAVLLIFLSGIPLFNELFVKRLFEASESGTSGQIRFVIPWIGLINSIVNYPFGVGPGNSSLAINEFLPSYYYLVDYNNGWAKIGTECGFLALVIYICFSVYVCKFIKKENIPFGFALFSMYLLKEITDGTILTESYIYFVIVIVFSGVSFSQNKQLKKYD